MNEFFKKLAKTVNTGQTRSVILSGNTHDLFWTEDGSSEYVPLIEFLLKKCQVPANGKTRGLTIVTYEVNSKVKFYGDGEKLKAAWDSSRTDKFDSWVEQTYENATMAMEFMRQVCIVSREQMHNNDLVVIIEAADLLMPTAPIASLSFNDRKRCAIVHGWLSDPVFCNGSDTVVLIAESPSSINEIVSRLPQILNVEIPYPDLETRKHFIHSMQDKWAGKSKFDEDQLAKQTAGLSVHAIRQLLCSDTIDRDSINTKVEQYICSQLGDDVVEFKRPTHGLADVMGFSKIKAFIQQEMIPRFRAEDESALPGAAVAGPIGGGKTFIMEAMAAELDIPVLVLKNMRSQWFGQTDVIFERLYRTLIVLDKVMIFVDEADTQFGGVGADTHETERRLTGKIQAMMSDVKLRGKVIWLLMTARIERLSADIRRPGRVGDLIIPILDPEGQDRKEFLESVLKLVKAEDESSALSALNARTQSYSAASFTALRSRAKAEKVQSVQDLLKIAEDIIPSDIEKERKYQKLQALLNCTRKSLLPDMTTPVEEAREAWRKELEQLSR